MIQFGGLWVGINQAKLSLIIISRDLKQQQLGYLKFILRILDIPNFLNLNLLKLPLKQILKHQDFFPA